MNLSCAANVAEMENLGKFPVNFNVYGCAYQENGKTYYRVSNNIEKMYDYMQNGVYHNIYPTLIQRLSYSCTILADEYEARMEQVKYHLARKMQTQYHVLFSVIEPFANTENNNAGYDLLQDMLDNIDGHFDNDELQLLEGAIDFAYRGKILDKFGYAALMQEVRKIRRQMDDDSILQDNFMCTMSGFGYEENGRLKYYHNAQRALVLERQHKMIADGRTIMPLYKKTYWRSSSHQLREVKNTFINELQQLEGPEYFTFIKKLKSTAGVLSEKKLDESIARLSTLNLDAHDACETMCYYRNLWNKR